MHTTSYTCTHVPTVLGKYRRPLILLLSHSLSTLGECFLVSSEFGAASQTSSRGERRLPINLINTAQSCRRRSPLRIPHAEEGGAHHPPTSTPHRPALTETPYRASHYRLRRPCILDQRFQIVFTLPTPITILVAILLCLDVTRSPDCRTAPLIAAGQPTFHTAQVHLPP